MILLRQKLYATAERNPKSRRKQHRAAKKAWEEAEGKKIIVQPAGFNDLADAGEIAKREIQLEKNGAKGTVRLGGLTNLYQQGKNWNDNVDPETIKVGEDEIARRKFRNKTYRSKPYTPNSMILDEYRNKKSFPNRWMEMDKKRNPDKYKRDLEERQKEIKEEVSRIEKSKLDQTKTRLRPDGEYAQNLKYKNKTRKLTPRAEEIRKHKSLGRKIKEGLGIGMSKKAKERIAAKNKEEDRVIRYRLEKAAKNDGTVLNDHINSFLTPANRAEVKIGEGKEFGLVTAHRGDHMAHELGHEYYQSKGKGLGKLAHKLDIGSDRHSNLTLASGISSGIASGINKAHKEAKGEKESTLNKLSPALTSLAVSSPMLVAEAAASKHGMKLIKGAGATRRYQKAARKELTRAWGTYATVPAYSSAAGYGAKNIAYKTEKARLKNKEKKKDDNN